MKNAEGFSSSGSVFSLNVASLPSISSTGTIDPLYTSTTSQLASLTYSATTNNPISYTVQWDEGVIPNQEATPFAFSENGGVINTITIPANVPAGTYTGYLYINNEATCQASREIYLTISELPSIHLPNTALKRCVDAHPFPLDVALPYDEQTGNPITYSIVWNASPANNLTPVTDAILPASPIIVKVLGTTPNGTYTGTLTVKNASGYSSPLTFTLTTSQGLSLSTTGTISPVCASSSSQTTTLNYSSSSVPESYSIDWNAEANTASLSDQDNTAFSFVPGAGTVDSIVIPANVPAGTYSGQLRIYFASCSTSYPVSITVNPSPTAPVIASVTVSAISGTVSVNLSGLPASGTWTITSNPVTQTTNGSGQTASITGLAAGDYTFTVTNAAGCSSPPSSTATIPSLTSKAVSQSNGTKSSSDLESADNKITVSSSNKVIQVDALNQTIDKVYVFDVAGNLIYKKEKVANPTFVINDLRAGNQILVVKVVLNNNRIATKKVIY